MVKFVLLIILSLLTLQKSAEDYPGDDEIDLAHDEVLKIQNEILDLSISIDSKKFYYDFKHPQRIDKIIEEFNIRSENKELNNKIKEIYDKENKKDIDVTLCHSDVLMAAFHANDEHDEAVKKCSSKAKSVSEEISPDLKLMLDTTNKLYTDIKSDKNDCLNAAEQQTPEITIKCLRDVVNKFRPKYEDMNTDYEKNVSTMNTKVENSLEDLKECIKQITDFSKVNEDIINTFTKCLKSNSATNIYSKHILYFCLCLFCFLRLM